jgi:HEPN domain-containing protein
MTERLDPSQARRWRSEAGDDLDSARVLLGTGRSRVACFLAHLAAEKALKSLMITRGEPFRHTHNLVELCKELPDEWCGRFDVDRLQLLNPWVTAGRYTIERQTITVDDAEMLVSVSGDVLAAVEEIAAATEGDR